MVVMGASMVSGYCFWSVLCEFQSKIANRLIKQTPESSSKKRTESNVPASNKKNANKSTSHTKKTITPNSNKQVTQSTTKESNKKIANESSIQKGIKQTPTLKKVIIPNTSTNKKSTPLKTPVTKENEALQPKLSKKQNKDLETEPLCVGTTIILKGLKSASIYNGKRGTIWSNYDSDSGRYIVKLDDGGKEISVRPANFTTLDIKATAKSEEPSQEIKNGQEHKQEQKEPGDTKQEKKKSDTIEKEKEKDNLLITFQPGTLGIGYEGTLITNVKPNGQAALAGVKTGWQIISVNNKNCSDITEDVSKMIDQAIETNKAFTLLFRKPVTITFKPERFGIKFMGNMINFVHADSQAFLKGVRKDWKIFSVNGKPQPDNTETIAKEMERTKNQGLVTIIVFYNTL